MSAVRRIVLVLLVLALSATPIAHAQEGGGTAADEQDVVVVRTDEEARTLDGVEVAVRLSQRTVPTGAEVRRVVLASSSSFADGLSAAVAQADGPMLLTAPDELPVAVHAELVRLEPQEVVLLGGPSVISSEVEAQVGELGLRTVRLAGASRFETATAMAGHVARSADTAIVVRAFDAVGGNGSAAWADSVTVGALSAATGWPVLLSETDTLTGSTRTYLRQSEIRTVVIVGGTAAISRETERTLLGDGHRAHRIAGADRLQTAVQVAGARGVSAGSRAVLVPSDGDLGWQAGLASAAHAAASAAMVVPVGEGGLTADLQRLLADAPPRSFTCVVSRTVCEEARSAAGMASSPLVSYNPPPGSVLAPEERVVIGADDPERTLRGEASVTSDCAVGGISYLPEGGASFAIGSPVQANESEVDSGADPVQPEGAGGNGPQTQPGGGQVEPLPDDESGPGVAQQMTCTVTATFERVDGGTLVDQAVFQVVEVHPVFRVTSFRQVEDAPVSFQDRSTGLIGAWAWDFGDGSAPVADREPTHVFDARGCVDVSLRVTSVLAHWFNGRQFVDEVVRSLAIDPADDDTHIGVRVVDGATGARMAGVEVEAIGPGGDTRRARSAADGMVTWTDLAPGQWRIGQADDPSNGFEQQVVSGRTVCPVLTVGPVGSLTVSVEEADGAPVAGAAVTVVRDARRIASGTTDSAGEVRFEELPVASYEVTATDASGMVVGETTAAVPEGQGAVTITRPAP